jgi:hypothetical protein
MLGARSDLLPDLLPVYMVTVVLAGIYWDSPQLSCTNESQLARALHDSNSLGGTIKPQVRGLCGPISSAKSGHKCTAAESGRGGKPQLRGCVDALV